MNAKTSISSFQQKIMPVIGKVEQGSEAYFWPEQSDNSRSSVIQSYAWNVWTPFSSCVKGWGSLRETSLPALGRSILRIFPSRRPNKTPQVFWLQRSRLTRTWLRLCVLQSSRRLSGTFLRVLWSKADLPESSVRREARHQYEQSLASATFLPSPKAPLAEKQMAQSHAADFASSMDATLSHNQPTDDMSMSSAVLKAL